MSSNDIQQSHPKAKADAAVNTMTNVQSIRR